MSGSMGRLAFNVKSKLDKWPNLELGWGRNSNRQLPTAIPRRGSRISARGGRQGIDDLIWDRDEHFLTYINTDLQPFKMFIAILCLNGIEQPVKRHQCTFFLPLR